MRVRRNANDEKIARGELLQELGKKGITLPESDIQFLEENNLVQVNVPVKKGEAPTQAMFRWETLFRSDKIVSPVEAEADKRICIVEPPRKLREKMLAGGRILMKDLHEKELEACATFYGENTKISKEDWLPASLDEHTQDFRDFINSINDPNGFFNVAYYHKFHLYRQQAQQWEREYQPPDMPDPEYRRREMERCRENSLYGLNRSLELKEASATGMSKYIATRAHEILLYLLDCGYSMDIAKARQIAFTTTICGWAMLKAMYNRNFIAKYISEDKEKAEATINDKLKYPFGKLAQWMRPHVDNDWLGGLFFGRKVAKGVTEGNNSIIEVVAAKQTAVASSTPTVTLVDEIGQIDSIQDIESDVEPTLYGYNPKTQKQELMRQYVQWGTGGYMNGRAGVAFQGVFLTHLTKWRESSRATIIPLFFNCWWRPGFSREQYDDKYKEAYSGTGPEAEKKKTKFHQAYPITLDDVFKTGGNKLVPEEWINERLRHIEAKGQLASAMYGYFEPVYDESRHSDEGSDVPFKIVGANFVPCESNDKRVTTCILDNRRPWRNRYYQGTDPIASKSGLSNMASVIWDKHWNTPVAVVNCRHQGDPRKDFLQVMLLGMYYDIEGKGAVKELIEANIGAAYEEYKRNKGLAKSLVWESELPESLQSKRNTAVIGIDNKGLRNDHIITWMRNVFLTYGNNIWIPVFFEQLKNFVEKIKEMTTVWEPIDKRINRDDTLFALTYSYICSMCFTNRMPEAIESTSSTKVVKEYKLVRGADGRLTRQLVRKKVNVLRPEYVATGI
jgi:hypothetical protein